ncbi:adenylate/guanylate cyclase domain-containing protein [Mesorhizobium neociceri]|uniref:Adenylate/guanylate cyclase domain-containing protein n=1 Tax=Mesorhizobium neociceri TaxID=1307853 RepID=A0A838BBD3_9HYPH|nr:adenylate/guanylate cyclase domain-containing protein [Mesorhizobium neociceri]MBA1143988.1 adenylate/guanylate cyclase domain-containing protein [Mesorhizobium neociceri]
MERKLAAILVADVVGYGRLMGLDEEGTLDTLGRIRVELLSSAIADHQGRVVKNTGDGYLVEFPSVVNALACAVEIQRGMRQRNQNMPYDRRVEFRIGVNLGDVIVEDGDIFGDGVNLAARLEACAEPGGISVSDSVRDHVGTRLGLVFEDMGEQSLKNIAKPVRIHNVSIGATPPGGQHREMRAPVNTHDERPRVAVLPFNNMSGDPEQEYFSDGITEDIITDLSKVSGLHVVARNTVFTYKGKPIEVQRAAQELGVRYVLEGSVRKAGHRVRVTGQLIDGKDGAHIWADRYDRDLTDIFAIQDEITHTIVEQLKVRLLPEEKTAIERTPTVNVEAYTYYLRGREFFREWTKSYLSMARRMFAMAVALDPNYARAYAGIADCDSAMLVWHSEAVSLEAIAKMSAKAVSLDPGLAEAHASLGLALMHDGRLEESVVALQQALALDPNSYEANFFYARYFYLQGSFQYSAEYFERAAEIRSDDYVSAMFVATTLRRIGQFGDAERWARKGIELAEGVLKLHPENAGPAHRGAILLAYLGERERAREWAARALLVEPDDLVAQFNVACAYSVMGDHEEALDFIERILPTSTWYQRAWFDKEPDLDPIRGYPRFQEMFAVFAGQLAPLTDPA